MRRASALLADVDAVRGRGRANPARFQEPEEFPDVADAVHFSRVPTAQVAETSRQGSLRRRLHPAAPRTFRNLNGDAENTTLRRPHPVIWRVGDLVIWRFVF